MNIVSILNNAVATITNCDKEPIHIPGSIQPHGFLLAADSAGIIRFCSENVVSFLGHAPAQLLNRPLQELDQQLGTAVAAISASGVAHPHPLRFEYNAQAFDIIVHSTDDGHVILEGEPYTPSAEDAFAIYEQTRTFTQLLERSRTLQDLCQRVAGEVRRITGYDRVMVYRFDKEYNGEVYAESRRDDIDPFLGLHYPHTDIPAQARELYLRNHCRIITDVSYTPVPLLTMTDGNDQQLDLSDAVLRSVSPIHLQYLKNMGVHATLTISLILEGRLWGLIACHHMQPWKLPYAKRLQALMQGHFLSSQIRVRQAAEEYEVNVNVEAHLQQLLNRVDADEDFSQKFDQFTSLMQVTNATGVVVLHQGTLYEKGIVPPRDKTLALIRWIAANTKSVMFATSQLSSRYPAAKAISQCASGIIFHALGKPTEHAIIWFREELERTVRWAGRPDLAVQRDPQTKALTPRNSFEVWREEVREQSAEWRVSEINAAIRFATTLQNHFHLLHVQQEESNLRLLNEQLTKANQELANINWITSHDLREPLRKIQVFASRIMDKESENISTLILDHIKRIQQSAARMQYLVDDIMNFTVIGNKDDFFEISDLNLVVNDVVAELKEDMDETDASVEVSKLPSDVRAIPHQMNQLFTNLIGNAIKFGKSSEPVMIRVECQVVSGAEASSALLDPEGSYYKISVIDNGIGFDNAKAKKIFDIFYKLHAQQDYKGTGIGLAICKRIAENHGGLITAAAVLDQGARFDVYLPRNN